ncbi:hypothetical protein AgCh_016413 [Apium graveolens]
MTKSPFSGHGERAADLLGLVHTDVCGPMSTQAMGGFSYFIAFIDDRSRFRYVYLMKHKSEAFEKFKEYKYEVEKQTKHSIITLQSDRGGEYLNGEFLAYLKENGIFSQWTTPYTPQLNGPIRRSGRVSRQPERYYGLVIENDNKLSIIDDDDHVTYNEAMSSVDSEKWHSAMKSEMESMYTNQVWTLVEAPEGVKPIGCKWVYKRKIGADGQVETYKARLVAKGFRQRQGIDFDETFLPIALLKSIRILFAIGAYYDYEIWQMDVKTTFLNGKLEEEVYMTQPEGFLSKGNEHLVCANLLRRYNPGVDFSAGRGIVYVPGKGLSTGGIAGIVVVVAVGLLLLVGYFGFYKKKKTEKIRLSTASEDPSTHAPGGTLLKGEENSVGASTRLTGISVDKSVEFSLEELAKLQMTSTLVIRLVKLALVLFTTLNSEARFVNFGSDLYKCVYLELGKAAKLAKEAHEIFGNVDDLLKRRKQGLTEMNGFDDPPGRRNELRNIGGFDPTILSEKYMTENDNNIRNIDFPKRLQLRNMIHLYRRIVETSELPIVKEDVMRFLDFIHIQKLDVSFIAMYRKDECPSLFKDPEQLEADGLQNSYDKKPALMWHKLFGGSALTLQSGASF